VFIVKTVQEIVLSAGSEAWWNSVVPHATAAGKSPKGTGAPDPMEILGQTATRRLGYGIRVWGTSVGMLTPISFLSFLWIFGGIRTLACGFQVVLSKEVFYKILMTYTDGL
jgi:hypothetical protein